MEALGPPSSVAPLRTRGSAVSVWREAKQSYAAMLDAALQPKSGVDHTAVLFLRQKLQEADRKIAGFRRDPRQEAGHAALMAKRNEQLIDLKEMRKEIKKKDKKEKKKKKKEKDTRARQRTLSTTPAPPFPPLIGWSGGSVAARVSAKHSLRGGCRGARGPRGGGRSLPGP